MQLQRWQAYGVPGGSLWPTPGLCPGEVGRKASISTYLYRFIENANTGAGGAIAWQLREPTAMAAGGWMSCSGRDVTDRKWRRKIIRVVRANKFKCKLLWAIVKGKRKLFVMFVLLYDKNSKGNWHESCKEQRFYSSIYGGGWLGSCHKTAI